MGSRAHVTGRTHDLSATAPYTTVGWMVEKCGWLDGLGRIHGWLDGEERLGLAARVTDMPHRMRKPGHGPRIT